MTTIDEKAGTRGIPCPARVAMTGPRLKDLVCLADIVGWKKRMWKKVIKLYINKESVLRAIIYKVEKECQTNEKCDPG